MAHSEKLTFALTGTGQQLMACGDLVLARGHGIVGVSSNCPETSAWARQRGLNLEAVPTSSAWLADKPFDYLLSIVNHAILPEELIGRARRAAINYHDSLLPEYAGFNATSWAIFDGKSRHGITWHLMTSEADRGDVLLRREIDIADDDTAFTLGVKCAEAGVASFGALLDEIENNKLQPQRQAGAGSYHPMSDRPGVAVLDFSKPASELVAMVRALNFGPEESWMAKPKFWLPGGPIAVTEARIGSGIGRAPGTILSISDSTVEVAANPGSVVFAELSTLAGESVSPAATMAAARMVVGDQLPIAPANVVTTANAFDATIAKWERFWVRRLTRLSPAEVPGNAPRGSRGERREIVRPMPAALAGLPASARDEIVAAAFAVYLARLGTSESFDIAFSAPIPADTGAFFAEVVPYRCEVALDAPFARAVEHARAELALQRQRRSFARDAVLRHAQVKGRDLRMPLALTLSDVATTTDVATLTLAAGPRTISWRFADGSLSMDEVTAIADRFDVLLVAAMENDAQIAGALPMLPAAERDRLLVTWQQTERDFDPDATVHQLFERQVERTPDAVAAAFGDASITYRELNVRANRLAHRLRAEGVGPDVLVGISVRRSIDMVTSLLGILKAGGAYVPMDPTYPRERLAMMLEDSKAPIVITQAALLSRLPDSSAKLILIDDAKSLSDSATNPAGAARATDLAYVIFTSGSTGRPKGTMLEHRNVVNFFAGMDDVLGTTPGVWLAVTSISFDISVLELLWTLTRGFKVVVAPESDRASIEQRESAPAATRTTDFGLFYFAADSGSAQPGNAYRLLLEGARFADENGFTAVWTPERHFHAFGGLYPNPAVTTAALATITKRVHLRAGSVVLPLHNPLRVAEDWAVIDQLSGGRVGLSFASGWHVNDFAFMPENFERRREIMLEHIDTILKLWRGEKVTVKNGANQPIEVGVLPRPIQQRPPMWIASAGTAETFILAGRIGANVLTNMLGQDIADLKSKFAAYHEARRAAGHEGPGNISVMLHTFVTHSDEEARRLARKPFADYLASSFDLVKVAPKMFPAFRQPSKGDHAEAAIDATSFSAEDMQALLDHAFDRYFDTAGLFGTPERAMEMVDRLADIGATEIACLIDFGIDPDEVLKSLPHLARLQAMCRNRPIRAGAMDSGRQELGELIRRHAVTHLQCTPSMGRALMHDAATRSSLASLRSMLLGGEALPADLAKDLRAVVQGKVLNMYGPTETTVWSTTSAVTPGSAPTIGRPIANTTIRILDARGELTPVGIAGEIHIGGAGVARGYLDRAELTAERFVADRWNGGGRMYRTGDLGRYRTDGEIEFLGRIDHQVKVNGHRIELGEIESALGHHVAVRQSVVVARKQNDASSELVAYVVLSNQQQFIENDAELISEWQTVWDEAYRTDSEPAEPRFRIAGWNDSFTGEPLAAEVMREWVDRTVERIQELEPRRILEIGCGTGLLLYRLLPHVGHYTAADISREALDSIRAELTPAESAKVTLLLQPAHALEGVAERSCDAVVINSVVQYFPDADYLRTVIERAADLVADGGCIFVGDVRSLAHLDAFHTAVQLRRAASSLDVDDLRERVNRGIDKENELVLAEGFFDALRAQVPRVGSVEIHLKRGTWANELTAFRYDVVLRVGPGTSRGATAPAALRHVDSLDAIRQLLATSPDVVHLADVPNSRLAAYAAAQRALDAEEVTTAGELRGITERATGSGVDPEALHSLHPDYEVDARWASSGDPWRFDAILRHRSRGPGVAWPRAIPVPYGNATIHANTPGSGNKSGSLTTQLRTHLRATLPEYMVPNTFVVMDGLPLTPNGKIDRARLPEPHRRVATSDAPFVAPTGDLEQRIAEIWKEVLAVERVGRSDNIFDLGANSLLTMQANSRLSALLGRKVSLVSMFRFPTVESLAGHLAPADERVEAEDRRAKDRAQRAESAAERRRALRKEQ